MYECLVIDCETTGGTPPEVIELSVRCPALRPIGNSASVFCNRYKPAGKILFGAMVTHHILESDLEGCPPSSEAKIPECQYLIGHKVDYDWEAVGKPDCKRICTLALSQLLHPEIDSHKLGAMMYFYLGDSAREWLLDSHDADVDTLNCCTLLEMLTSEAEDRGLLKEDWTWEDLWNLSEIARVPTHFTFGAHEGKPIGEAPLDYLQWLSSQPKVDPYLKQALDAAIALRPPEAITVMPWGKHKGKLLSEVPYDYVAWVLGQDNLQQNLREALENLV